jgi:hypothetical protein
MRYVPDTPQNAERCNCSGCPSNPEQSLELHCGRMIYRKHIERKGCLCSTCPILRTYELSGEYYCHAAVH